MSFNKTQSRVVIGLLTGHNTLRRNLHIMGLSKIGDGRWLSKIGDGRWLSKIGDGRWLSKIGDGSRVYWMCEVLGELIVIQITIW